ncbi:hypothetical protein GCM10027614_37750 [Micromonospora vulcania]
MEAGRLAPARHADPAERSMTMGKTLKRGAAFAALARALAAGSRGGPSLGTRLAALPRMIMATVRRSTTAAFGWS